MEGEGDHADAVEGGWEELGAEGGPDVVEGGEVEGFEIEGEVADAVGEAGEAEGVPSGMGVKEGDGMGKEVEANDGLIGLEAGGEEDLEVDGDGWRGGFESGEGVEGQGRGWEAGEGLGGEGIAGDGDEGEDEGVFVGSGEVAVRGDTRGEEDLSGGGIDAEVVAEGEVEVMGDELEDGADHGELGLACGFGEAAGLDGFLADGVEEVLVADGGFGEGGGLDGGGAEGVDDVGPGEFVVVGEEVCGDAEIGRAHV